MIHERKTYDGTLVDQEIAEAESAAARFEEEVDEQEGDEEDPALWEYVEDEDEGDEEEVRVL